MIKEIKIFTINKIKELKKIQLTKPKDLISNFIVVLLFSVIMTLMIYGLDLLVVYIQNIILSLF